MEDIKAGRLTHILPTWTLPAGGIHAVYPAARFRPPKVTVFVSMLMEEQKVIGDTPEGAVPLDVMRMFVQWPTTTFQQMGTIAGLDADYKQQLGIAGNEKESE